jgi:hypothetical protein
MKIFLLRWIPHELTDELREIMIEEYRELHPMLEGLEKRTFPSPVTDDESWFALQFQHSAKWTVSRNDVPQKVRQLIGTSKLMLRVMSAVDGFHIVNLMTSRETFNSQYFIDTVLTHLPPKIFP